MSKKNYKDYLEKTFIEELNYKIWTTKGSCFNANKRLLLLSKNSNLANSILSVYLIAIGLLSVYNINSDRSIGENILAYYTTCISILLLVFSQIENSKNYQLKAKEFHNCGIELSCLYNQLRIFKTLKLEPTNEEKEMFAKDLSAKYESILGKHDNHDFIDYCMFTIRYPNYFELSFIETLKIKIKYYIKTQFFFHMMILVPPVISIFFILR